MKIKYFIKHKQPYIDECVEPIKTDFINFKHFMSMRLPSQTKKIPNQKPNDIIKRSYRQEKKEQKEWEELLRRVFR